MPEGSIADVLAFVLDKVDRENLRDYMTNAEIAEWMASELRTRGITVIDLKGREDDR